MKEQQSERNSGELSARRYYGLYTLAFLIVSLLVFFPFLYNGKSFIFCDTNQGGDGLVQHYNSFVYYGHYLREILKTLLTEGRLEIPLWDMSIGYGQDIVNTLSYYVIGDPFAVLAVFFPTRYAEYGYSFAILLRFYCAGAAFSAFCRYRGRKGFPVLIGSLVYVFCYYGLMAGTLHPYFLLPMIWLPLILIGVDQMLKGTGRLIYIGFLALAGISNFYFFYMICIMVVLYTVSRYLELFSLKDIRHLLKKVGEFILASVYAVMMAAVILIPSILGISGASRISVENYVPAFYSYVNYLKTIPAFVSGGFRSYTYYGYCGLGLAAVILLFMRIRKEKQYAYMALRFAVLMLFSMIPFAGHLLNGMGYVTNRWIWALSMMVAWIIVVLLPDVLQLKKREALAITGVILLTLPIAWISCKAESEESWPLMAEMAVAEMVITLLILLVISRWKSGRKKQLVCLGMTILCLAANSVNCFYSKDANHISKYTDRGSAYKLLVKESPEYGLTELDDESVYRFDVAHISTGAVKRNSAMQIGLYGVPYYYSTTNSKITDFITDLAMNYSMDQSYNNLDRRTFLEALFGVKYVIIPEGNENCLPYGYDTLVNTKKGYAIYQADQTLPMGFTSDHLIGESRYQELTEIQKQEALLEGVIVPDEYADAQADLEFTGEELPYEITAEEGISIGDGTITVTDTSATLTVTFSSVQEKELYLVFRNLSFEGTNPLSLYTEDSLKSMTRQERRALKAAYASWTEPTSAVITMKSGENSTTLVVSTWKNNYYCGHTQFLGNLGYSTSGRDQIVITFSETGTYSLDEMVVAEQSMENYDSYLTDLSEESLQNCQIGTNCVSGSVSVSDSRVLCLQIPYSSNWKVTVDGEEQETILADQMFLGVMLDEGTHEVVFTYHNPILWISLSISCICSIGFLAAVFGKKKRRGVKTHS